MNNIKVYFGVGNISIKANGLCVYYVQSIKDLDVILNHFDKYPLITKKHADYLLFKMAIDLIKNKEHLNQEGLRKLIALRASLNWGLPSALEAAFPNIIPYPRPSILDFKIKDPQWLTGFTSGDGCFLVRIIKSSSQRTGFQVSLMFTISQHSRDEQLMKSLISYFGCGHYVPRNNKDIGEFIVTKFEDINNKVIPLFDKYPILGCKYKDYVDFKRVSKLIQNKNHLTSEGLEKIRLIKIGMNRGRNSIIDL